MKTSLSNALTAYLIPSPESYRRPPLRQPTFESRFPDLVDVTPEACEALGIKGLKEAQLNAIGAKWEPQQQILHFQLRNAAHHVVGEKVLHLGSRCEETFQEGSSSGILIYGVGTKSKAVIVSNLVDFIVLATQNLETRKELLYFRKYL